jgi:hypothetical protein
MLGHAYTEVTACHYARAGEDAAEALGRALLQTDNPVQLAKTGCAGEAAACPASRDTAQIQERPRGAPRETRTPGPDSEEASAHLLSPALVGGRA